MKKTLKEIKKAKLEIELKKDRLILHFEDASGGIGGTIDVTPLYHFLKIFFKTK